MRSLAVTCKRLSAIVRYALFQEPVLRSSKVNVFLELLFMYPTLRTKIKGLTIETKEIQGEEFLPDTIPGLKPQLLRDCIREVENLPINPAVKSWWVADLRAEKFFMHGTMLTLLLAMVSGIKELYLGGSILINLPLFRGLLSIMDAKVDLELPKSVYMYSS
jgi:hypothetical protein